MISMAMIRQIIKAVIVVVVVSIELAGCAGLSKKSEDDSKFKVSVQSSGKPVKDFSTPLVHRITVSKYDFNRYTRSKVGGKPEILTTFQPVHTAGPKSPVYGLKLIAVSGATGGSALGLQLNDIVTAVGPDHVVKSSDFQQLFQHLLKDKTVSVTLMRGGKPHKIIYYLDS